jgi:hypothetical protein
MVAYARSKCSARDAAARNVAAPSISCASRSVHFPTCRLHIEGGACVA